MVGEMVVVVLGSATVSAAVIEPTVVDVGDAAVGAATTRDVDAAAGSTSSPCASGPARQPASADDRHDGARDRSDAEGTGHLPSVTRRRERLRA